MKFQIEDFITKLNTIQCSDSIEFRQRFTKLWLKYLTNNSRKTERDLLRMIFEYQKFIAIKKNTTN